MATQTKHLISDVLQYVSDLRGETTTNTDAVRIRSLSRVEQDFALRRFWRFYLLPNQTDSGDGTNDYEVGSATYPMRPKGLTEVFVGGTAESQRYEIVDYNRFKLLYNQNNAERLVYEWYDATNDAWKMHINPAPESGATITYSYYWMPPSKTSSGEYVYCPKIRILAKLTLGEIYESEEEVDLANTARAEAEQLIIELIGIDNSPAVNQTYSMGAIENSVTQQGIGSY